MANWRRGTEQGFLLATWVIIQRACSKMKILTTDQICDPRQPPFSQEHLLSNGQAALQCPRSRFHYLKCISSIHDVLLCL